MFQKIRLGIAFLLAAAGLFAVAVQMQISVRTSAGGYPDSMFDDANRGVAQTNAYLDIAGDFARNAVAAGFLIGLAMAAAVLGLALIIRNFLPAAIRESKTIVGPVANGVAHVVLIFAAVASSVFAFGAYLGSDPTLEMKGYRGPLADSATVASKDVLEEFLNGRVFYGVFLGLALALTVTMLLAILVPKLRPIRKGFPLESSNVTAATS